MNPTELPVGLIWRFLSWLPRPILRRKFPQARMAELVQFEIHARHDPVTLDLGRPASLRLSAFLENKSPFHIEMDRGRLTFHYAGQQVSIDLLDRVKLPPAARQDFYWCQPVHEEQANFIAKNLEGIPPQLDGFIHFNARLENFRKEVRLTGIRPAVMNTAARNGN